MNIFGIGPLELLVVLAVALIFLGPEKLPEMARALGKAVHQFQRMIEPYREEIARAIEPVDEVQRDMKQALRGASSLMPAASSGSSAATARAGEAPAAGTPLSAGAPIVAGETPSETTVLAAGDPVAATGPDQDVFSENTIAPPHARPETKEPPHDAE